MGKQEEKGKRGRGKEEERKNEKRSTFLKKVGIEKGVKADLSQSEFLHGDVGSLSLQEPHGVLLHPRELLVEQIKLALYLRLHPRHSSTSLEENSCKVENSPL